MWWTRNWNITWSHLNMLTLCVVCVCVYPLQDLWKRMLYHHASFISKGVLPVELHELLHELLAQIQSASTVPLNSFGLIILDYN